MAADALGLGRIEASALLDEIRWPPGVTVGLVETVGGVRSPMSDDADSAQFAALVKPDRTVLVADAGLGTINSVRLSLQVLGQALDVGPILVFLNRFDDTDLHRRNREWLTSRDGFVTATEIADVCRWIIGESGSPSGRTLV
jgi:dethiobiotin synthetase